jgi:hypothetical protein
MRCPDPVRLEIVARLADSDGENCGDIGNGIDVHKSTMSHTTGSRARPALRERRWRVGDGWSDCVRYWTRRSLPASQFVGTGGACR